jgi:hypothetical protein
MREPKVLNEYLKGSLGRFAIPMPEIARSDPFWLNEDPHRTAHTQQALIGPTLPIYEAYNPAIAEVNPEHVFSIAEFDVMNNGMAPEQAIDKAFKWAEAIFAPNTRSSRVERGLRTREGSPCLTGGNGVGSHRLRHLRQPRPRCLL